MKQTIKILMIFILALGGILGFHFLNQQKTNTSIPIIENPVPSPLKTANTCPELGHDSEKNDWAQGAKFSFLKVMNFCSNGLAVKGLVALSDLKKDKLLIFKDGSIKQLIAKFSNEYVITGNKDYVDYPFLNTSLNSEDIKKEPIWIIIGDRVESKKILWENFQIINGSCSNLKLNNADYTFFNSNLLNQTFYQAAEACPQDKDYMRKSTGVLNKNNKCSEISYYTIGCDEYGSKSVFDSVFKIENEFWIVTRSISDENGFWDMHSWQFDPKTQKFISPTKN